MRGFVVFLTVAAFLAVPAGAEAICGCAYTFSNKYEASPTVQSWVSYDLGKRGVPSSKVRYFRLAMHDWQRRHNLRSDFCKNHPKACKAAVECALAGGLVYVGMTKTPAATRWRAAAFACAAAATRALIYG